MKNALEDAYKYELFLQKNPLFNQARVAEHFGVTRAKVTQELNLLKLAEPIQSFLNEENKNYEVNRFFTKRRLRPLTKLNTRDQELKFKQLLDCLDI